MRTSSPRRAAAPGAGLGHDDGAVRFDGRVQRRAVHRRAGEQHARTGQRRARGDAVGSFARQPRVCVRARSCQNAPSNGKHFRPADARRRHARSADQAPGRSAGGIGSRDLLGGDRRSDGDPADDRATVRRAAPACAPRRSAGTSGPSRLQQIEQHDRAQAPSPLPCARTHAGRESTCSPASDVRGNDDARRIARDVPSARPRRGAEAGSGKMPGSRCASAAGVGARRRLGPHRAQASGADDLDRNRRPRRHDHTAIASADCRSCAKRCRRRPSARDGDRHGIQMTPSARSCSTPADSVSEPVAVDERVVLPDRRRRPQVSPRRHLRR